MALVLICGCLQYAINDDPLCSHQCDPPDAANQIDSKAYAMGNKASVYIDRSEWKSNWLTLLHTYQIFDQNSASRVAIR